MNNNDTKPVKTGFGRRLLGWLKRHELDLTIAGLLVVTGAAVSGFNMTSYPQRFEDEGTYISQAWAIKEQGTLTHYTYWYDHPPLGWIQMAGHLELTDALGRYQSAISAGREFMLILHLVTIVLLYTLARRLRIGRMGSGLGVLAFTLSPLAVEFSRYVLLDNVGLPWTLAAFVLALSPRRSLSSAIGSALCMAIAILSKETFMSLLPVLLYVLWRNGDKRNRRYALTAFGVVLATISGFYILYAALKNELFPGPGHVSLLGTLVWQLFGRAGSGSVFQAGSGSRGLVGYWLNIDYWLLAAGLLTMIPALIYRHLRPAGLALLIGIVILLRGGYLPYPYVVALLPFAAICLAGALDKLVIEPIRSRRMVWRLSGIVTAVALTAGTALAVYPAWQPKLYTLTHADQDYSSRQTVDWVSGHVGRDKRMVVESALWTDMQNKGFDTPNPVWLYKTETDPEVTKEIGGWRGIDYVVLNGPTVSAKDFATSFPTVDTAIKHGKLVASFGTDNQRIVVYEIKH